MKRNLTFEEISDGRKYTADDYARVSCNGCAGCSECCQVTEDTILLDPYDIFTLSKGLKMTFEEMLKEFVDLRVVDGVVTPYLKKLASGSCFFLNKSSRCMIHEYRPGFCRLFPLGRIYDEDGSFKYFIQVHECPYPDKSEVLIRDWLSIDNLSDYEAFIRSWHEITKNLSIFTEESDDASAIKAVNMRLLSVFFLAPYDTTTDFYPQFQARLLTWGH